MRLIRNREYIKADANKCVCLIYWKGVNEMEYDKGIYNYYSRKYPEEILGDCMFITIPMMDGSESLDKHYINPRKEEGFNFHENWLLRLIYLIKPMI